MKGQPNISKFLQLIFTAILVSSTLYTASCGNDDGQVFVLARSSESGAIAISSDDTVIAVVNENGDSVSFFDVTTDPPTLIEEVEVGDEPVAVVIGPDNDTAFVVNQADATVSKIEDIKSDPTVVDLANVGSEPVGLALSPTGDFLYVAELTQDRVSKLATSNMEEVDSVSVPTPFGIAVTNDLDTDDNDETVIVTQVFGENTGVLNGSDEGDVSRRGKVHLFDSGNLAALGEVTFEPRSSGVQVQPGATVPTADAAGPEVVASPNQLYAVSIQGNNFFVPTISASPRRPIAVRGGNIHPIILAGSLSSESEVTALSVNLEKEIKDLVPDQPFAVNAAPPINGGGTRNFLGDTTALAVSPTESDGNQTVVYSVARGGDAIQRIAYDLVAGGVSIDDFDGDNLPDQIDLLPDGCRTPMGIAIANTTGTAFVNCRGTRQLVKLNLSNQAVANVTPTSTAPAGGSEQFDIERGQLLYFTARGRWSTEARSDCAACHFNGTLSDNIIWTFGAGPRRTIPMHWSYHDDADQDGVKEEQKILNWTGIFDEIRDFENNIIGVSGGVGVYTTEVAGVCDPNVRLQGPSMQGVANGGLNGSTIEFEEDNIDILCAPEDFQQLDLFVRTMRSPRAPKTFNNEDLEDSISRGRQLFATGNCQSCHGGPAWTASRLYYEVTSANTDNMKLDDSTIFPPPIEQIEDSYALLDDFFNPVDVTGFNFRFIQNEQNSTPTDAVGVLQESCVLREVDTFGDPLNVANTDLIEIRNVAPPTSPRAEGEFSGYNIPPLLGVQSNAPYFHHGLASTIEDLLTDPRWEKHLTAGDTSFELADADAVEDLKNFLLSIDEGTTPFTAPNQPVDACPQL